MTEQRTRRPARRDPGPVPPATFHEPLYEDGRPYESTMGGLDADQDRDDDS